MRYAVTFVMTIAVAAALQAPSLSAQGPGPIVRRGTSSIAGRVLTPDTLSPVRGAEVVATTQMGVRVSVMTDDEGAYRLDQLPAGTWRVTVSKTGFVTWEAGQRRPFEKVPPIALARGQAVTAIIPLSRGGAITGQVSNQTSEPVAGVEVRVYRARMESGARRLQSVGLPDLTDDRGAFRLYGLPPGDYYVAASLRLAPIDSVVETTYSPTYYPGTGNLAEAQRVRLGLGSEANATFAILPIRSARVSGFVMNSAGSPGDAYLNLESESTELGVPLGFGGVTRPDGSFAIVDVPPGRYRLTATLRGNGPEESGSIPVTVDGDLSGLNVVMGRHARLRGVIVADEGVSRLLPSALVVSAVAARTGMLLGAGAGRRFEIDTISEAFRLTVDGLGDRWVVKQITVNGLDATDTPAELGPGQDGEARIVVTDRLTELSGTAEAVDPSVTATVVIYPEDSTKWGPRSRYLRKTTVSSDGSFRVTGLPAGVRYLAVATDYLEEGEDTDPLFFDAMRGVAVPFSLGEGEGQQIVLKVVAR